MELGWNQHSDKAQPDHRSLDAAGSGGTPFVLVEAHFGRPALELAMEQKAEIHKLDWDTGKSFRDMLVRNLKRSKHVGDLQYRRMSNKATAQPRPFTCPAVVMLAASRKQTWKGYPLGNPPWPRGLPRTLPRGEPQSRATRMTRRVL